MDTYCSFCLLGSWILTDLDHLYEPGIRGETSRADGNLICILDGWFRSGTRDYESVNWRWDVVVPWCDWIIFVAGWIMVGLVKMNKVSVRNVNISVGQQFVSLWNKVKKGGFLVPGMLLQTTAGGILVPFLTSFAISHLGLSHSQLSIVLFMGGAGVVLFLVPMGKWFDHVGVNGSSLLGSACLQLPCSA